MNFSDSGLLLHARSESARQPNKEAFSATCLGGSPRPRFSLPRVDALLHLVHDGELREVARQRRRAEKLQQRQQQHLSAGSNKNRSEPRSNQVTTHGALQGLSGGAARGRVEREERGEQADRRRRQVPEPLGRRGLVRLGGLERRRELHLPPVVVRRRPEQLEDLQQLILLNAPNKAGAAPNVQSQFCRTRKREQDELSAHLATAVHESLAEEHLGEEAAGAPQVDADAVVGGAQQQLRSAVRERDDAVGGWLPATGAVVAGEAEVADLEHAVAVDHQVGVLDVQVKDAALVAVLQPLEHLLHVALDLKPSEH